MKIGRNEKCPCGSGKKYKKCCALKRQGQPSQETQENASRPTLSGAIADIQKSAAEKKINYIEIGVFLLFSDVHGDAWVLEVTDGDCIQVSSGAESLDVPLEETPETIVMEWSHTFVFRNKKLVITAYSDKEKQTLENAPTQQLAAAMKRVLKKISPELLSQVHIDG